MHPPRLWERIVEWVHDRDLDEGAPLMIVGAVIGGVAGLGIVGFYKLIDVAYALLTALPQRHVPWIGQAILQIVLTSFGVWLAWFIVRRARASEGQNVPDVQLAVAKRGGVIAGRPVVARTLASAVTLGSGGSVGSEGPVAVLGAAVGSLLGRRLRFQARHLKILVGCGAAAGIAGAFNAPFAGASSRWRRSSAPSPSGRSARSSSRASWARSPCAPFSARTRHSTCRRSPTFIPSRTHSSIRCSESRAGSRRRCTRGSMRSRPARCVGCPAGRGRDRSWAVRSSARSSCRLVGCCRATGTWRSRARCSARCPGICSSRWRSRRSSPR